MSEMVYISGPISKKPLNNLPAFRKTQDWLKYFDFASIIPHDISEYHVEKSWEDYMKDDIQFLVDCDYIYMLPGWWKSKGAIIERLIAIVLKIPRLRLPKEE